MKTEMRAIFRWFIDNVEKVEVVESERVRNVDVGNYGFEKMMVRVELRDQGKAFGGC